MIFVKTLEGRTVTLDVEQTETVLDIKKRLASLEGYDVVDQRITCEGERRFLFSFLSPYFLCIFSFR